MFFRRYRKQIIQFAIIWCSVAVWQILLMFLVFGYDVFDFFLLGLACYGSSVGYLIHHITEPCWHTMCPSEWQWITGIAIMLLLSVLASFSQNRTVRIVALVLLVILHLAGSFCSFGSMICAIT